MSRGGTGWPNRGRNCWEGKYFFMEHQWISETFLKIREGHFNKVSQIKLTG